jgi:three-Cys-motif partner protein
VTQSSDHFASFEPHTLLKHAIYRAYVERWARILGWSFNRLRIVDACAGTGADESGRPGSPLIAVLEADRASEQMTQEREKRGRPQTVQVEVVAIEKDARHFAELSRRMEAFAPRHAAFRGTLADQITALESDFPRVPTLFFIDPFGMEPLQADVVRRALKGPKNEVFLLFADQAALRHVGAADAVAEPEAAGPELDLFGESQPVPRAEPSRAAEITGKRAVEILDAAFDGLDWREAAKAPPGRRRQAFVDLYCELLRSFGATHVLALPVYDRRANVPKYHLIYATKSGRGYEVIKDSIERAWKGSEIGGRAVEMMRLGTQINDARLLQLVEEKFAGWREIQWSSDDSNAVTVRRFALEETPAMPSQMDDLRKSLAPLRVPGRRDFRFTFPSRTPS